MNEEIVIPTVVLPEQQQRGVTVLDEWASALSIGSQAEREAAVAAIKQVKERRKAICDFFADSKRRANEAWKSIVAMEKAFTDTLDRVEVKAKQKVLAYDMEQRRKAMEDAAKLQAELDAKAEAERKRAIAAAEKLKTPELREERIEAANSIAAPVVVAKLPEKDSATSTRMVWKAQVVDVAQLPRQYMEPNLKMLDGFAKATKGAVQVPGVRFYEEPVLAIR